MSTLVIIGASGHGKVVADAAQSSTKWSQVVFLDALWPTLQNIGPWPVVGGDQQQPYAQPMPFVVAIGNAAIRQRLQLHYQQMGWHAQIIVHASATISPHARLGAGTVVCAGAVVSPFATLGENCIVNTCASVDHDCHLAEGVHIAPGAHIAGDVSIGARTWIGIGASVIQGLHIGSDIMVGAGSAVVSNLREPGLYVGVPARKVVDKG